MLVFVFLVAYLVAAVIPTYAASMELVGAVKMLYLIFGALLTALAVTGIVSVALDGTLREAWEDILTLSYMPHDGRIGVKQSGEILPWLTPTGLNRSTVSWRQSRLPPGHEQRVRRSDRDRSAVQQGAGLPCHAGQPRCGSEVPGPMVVGA